ncbi:MAG: geranylgeranyl reductase family protein [Promethearchaeota archaeon]
MIIVDADVVVVGAGPVGGLAARQLARKGYSVLLLEEHPEVGRPVHCAGLIGIEGLKDNGLFPQSNVILQHVRRSIFYSPSGTQLVFDKGEPHAFVLNRDRLDQQIADEAVTAGATLQLETRVTKCQRTQKGVRVNLRERGVKRELLTRFVVNAEGIRAKLAHDQGLPRPKKHYMLPALQYEVVNVSLPLDTVHLFFNTQIAKDFFSWIIPLDNNRARVGLATAHKQARKALDKFLRQCSLLTGAKIKERFGGIVYTGGPSSRTINERFINLGDAAGQTKATTGGGVVSGGSCAILAALCISRALRDDFYDHRELIRYEGLWKRGWGRQLRLMAILRRLVNTLSNNELDHLFMNLQTGKAREIIERSGDIDYQGRLITAALTSPALIGSALKLLLKKIRFFPHILWG